jgi:hypothetical protein
MGAGEESENLLRQDSLKDAGERLEQAFVLCAFATELAGKARS